MVKGTGPVSCRVTELEDTLELEKLREKIQCDSIRNLGCIALGYAVACCMSPIEENMPCSSQEGTTGISSECKLSTIVAYSTLCLTAVDLSTNAVVGAIAFAPFETVNHILRNSTPDSELHKWIIQLASSLAAKRPNGLVIPFYVLDPDHEKAALLTILRTAFATSPGLKSLILLPEAPIPLNQPFLLSYFVDTGSKGPSGETAYISTRDTVCPALTVRPAVVEDTDDLVPIVQGAAERFGSLAKVQILSLNSVRISCDMFLSEANDMNAHAESVISVRCNWRL
jgi:hypothetical protein